MNRKKNWILVILLVGIVIFQARGQQFNIQSFGGVGDGRTLDTRALQAAIDACHGHGGGEVVIPSGIFLIGTVHLKSHIHLELRTGAILRGSSHLSDYEIFIPEKPFQPIHKGMFFTQDAEDITISGPGQIDGNGDHFFDLNQAKKLDSVATEYTRQGKEFREVKSGIGDGPLVPRDRPYQMLVFSHCKRITIQDLFITQAPFWCLHFADCDGVAVSGIRLWNNMLAPNADGIDITSCSNVILTGCDIRSGDDAIAVTGYNHHFEIPGFEHLKHISENIIISNCNLQSSSSGIRIGFLDQNTVRNIQVSDVNITNSTRGIGIFLRDEGSLENMTFSNIYISTHLRTGDWWGNGEPIHISAVRGKAGVKLGRINHIIFSHIICRGENGLLVYGSAESIIGDLEFNHIRFTLRDSPLNAVAGGNIDLRGCLDPRQQLFKSDIPGFLVRYVNGFQIHDFQLKWDHPRMPFFTNGLELRHVEGARITGFLGSGSPLDKKSYRILLKDSPGLITDDSSGVKKEIGH
ncbi:MAG: glycoside hydrolase family 28 protein [Chitinophagaceae bacterium]